MLAYDNCLCWHTQDKLRQRGVFESLRHDFIVGFGDWDYDSMDLTNPFPQNQSSIHIWQGYEDMVVSFHLQRYVSESYHGLGTMKFLMVDTR